MLGSLKYLLVFSENVMFAPTFKASSATPGKVANETCETNRMLYITVNCVLERG